jgi:hypothetical protein
MKKLIFTIAIGSLLMASCTSVRYQANYEFKLSEVKKSEKGSPAQISSSLDTLKGAKSNCYSDSTIKVCFTPTNKNIHFEMTNLTDQNVKLVWDESMITTVGSQSKVMHDGVKFIDRNQYQQPSIVYPNQTFKDMFTPTENVYWRDGVYSQYGSTPGGWEQKPLLIDKNYINGGTEVLDSTKFTDYVTSMKDATIQINMPILVDDTKRKDYRFNFKVVDGVVVPVEVADNKKTMGASLVGGLVGGLLLILVTFSLLGI